MKKVLSIVLTLLLILSMFGTVHVSAEEADKAGKEAEKDVEEETEAEAEEKTEAEAEEITETETEEETEAAVYALEDYSIGSICFSAPEDWELTFLGDTGCDLAFGNGSVLRMEVVYDNEYELPGTPEDAVMYGQMNLMMINVSGPASVEHWQYQLNGLDVDFYYANDAEAYDNCDLILIAFCNQTAAAVVSGELYEEDLNLYRADLLGMLMSLSAESEADEETVPEDEDSEEFDLEESEDTNTPEASDLEETSEEDGTEDTDDEEASDTEDTEDTDDAEAWTEKCYSGIRFLVPEDWKEEEGYAEGFFRFLFGRDSMFSAAIVPVESIEEEYESADVFMDELDASVKATASMLNVDVFREYKPFNLNGVDIHLFYLSQEASDGSQQSDYIRLVFAGAEGTGMISFNYMDNDPESFRPLLLGVLTSVTSESTAQEDEASEETGEPEEETEPSDEEQPEGDFESEGEKKAG